jgi:hypothetical protein
MEIKMKKLAQRQDGSHIVVVVLAIVMVGVIGFTGWRVYGDKNAGKETADKKPQVSLQKVVADIKTTLLADYTFLEPSPAQIDSGADVPYRVEGYDFRASAAATKDNFLSLLFKESERTQAVADAEGSTSVEESDRAEKADRDKVKPAHDKAAQMLADQGFRSEKSPNPQDSFTLHVRDDAICTLEAVFNVDLHCVTPAQLAGEAKKAKPYVEVYRKRTLAEGEVAASKDEEAFRLLETGAGGDARHTFAVLSTGQLGAWLYSVDGKWYYATSSQEGISCDNPVFTADAKLAFAKNCRKPGEGL